MLQEKFHSLVKKYKDDAALAGRLWQEIEDAYSGKERHFHNLAHLQQMFDALAAAGVQIEDEDSLALAVFYHDLVYDAAEYALRNNNEDCSAEGAQAALQAIGYPPEKIEKVKAFILATKHHQSASGDTDILTDADLSILGQPWEIYREYMTAIRREFAVYPDSIFNAGRLAVVKKFLRKQRLFKTEPFRTKFEATAKENLTRELEILSF